MKISYKLFFELIERQKIKKYSLVVDAGLSNNVIRHISPEKPITMDVLLRLCETLDCQPGDIVVFKKKQSISLQ